MVTRKHFEDIAKILGNNTIPDNYLKSPISLTPEFLKEIQSI